MQLPKQPSQDPAPFLPSMARRQFLGALAAGSSLVALGGETHVLADEAENAAARALKREDGRSRLPPGQKVVKSLHPMGGEAGNPSPGEFHLEISGEVARPGTWDFNQLLALPQVDQTCDVHCVTRWSVLDSHWTGVRLSELAAAVGMKASAQYVIFEAAHGYTSNITIKEALKPNVMLAHKLAGAALPRKNGPPVRALVPDLYFWKSAKWLTGIHFSSSDQYGYWEKRGYRNGADPWKEQRHMLNVIINGM